LTVIHTSHEAAAYTMASSNAETPHQVPAKAFHACRTL
jgi:hypothetical protein